MSYTNVYPSRINWENEPSIASPINATNLNKMDYALYQHDQTLENWDTTKAKQSDLLLCVKSIDYNTTTGVFLFTWQNGTTKEVDLNIEKIPVSFSMDANGVITMTTSDGTQYTADVGSLIKTYSFSDSSEIDFTVTTDQSGNKTVTASLKEGSIAGTKLEPNYLANCQSAANSASASKTAAENSAEDSEAWAVGQRDGVDVPSTDPAYHNNAKYYAEHGSGSSLVGLSDTDISSPTNGQALLYDSASDKWKNKNVATGSTVTVSTTETSLYGETVTLSNGGAYTLTSTFNNYGFASFQGVTVTGNVTISSGGISETLNIPYFGNYIYTLTSFAATITVTYPSGATCTCSKDGTTYTATGSPYTFTVNGSGTWVVSVTSNGTTKTQNVSITTSGQSESVNMVTESKTLTIYSAVEDTITFTDAAGTSRTETLATGQSSKSITFAIKKFGNTSITFTSSIAKNPDSLAYYYSKTVTITSATTEVYVMPDNALYWWGYESDNLEDMTSANGWSRTSYTFIEPTHETRDILLNPSSNQYKGVGTKNGVVASKLYAISDGVTASSGAYGFFMQHNSKTLVAGSSLITQTGYNTFGKSTTTLNLNNKNDACYLGSYGQQGGSMKLNALWYE